MIASAGTSHSDAIQTWTMYRSKIIAEDNLIYHRMSFMLWAEAILYGLWAAVAESTRAVRTHSQTDIVLGVSFYLIMLMLSGMGAQVASWTIDSVNAALEEIKNIKNEYKTNYPELNKSDLYPDIHGGVSTHIKGHIVAENLPSWFIGLQFITALFSLAGLIIYVVQLFQTKP